MKIIYVSVQCSEKLLRRLFEGNRYIPGQQAQKYNRLLAEGFGMQEDIKISHISSVPAYNNSIDGLFHIFPGERVRGIDYRYLPVLNVHRLQDILYCISSFFIVLSECIKNKNSIVVVDCLAAPAAYGAVCAAKIMNKKCIGIVTDVPDILFEKGKDTVYHEFSNRVIKKCDGYILLTEQMNEIMNPHKKPYIVVEGIVDVDHKETADHINNKKIYLYTGTINKLYGIKNLVEGFIDADIRDAELHIYGDGDYREELEKICKDHPNIRYHGLILNEKMSQIQQDAYLLINPRSDEGEYTKYSFPSKNMEYMVSGRPVLLRVLPGMPDEYKKYVYELDCADKEDICEKLLYIDSLDKNELEKTGRNARDFVLREKNNKKQAEKVIRWIKQKILK